MLVSRHPLAMGKDFGRIARPDVKWFFQIQMARSAEFVLWMLGGVYCSLVCCDLGLYKLFDPLGAFVVHLVKL